MTKKFKTSSGPSLGKSIQTHDAKDKRPESQYPAFSLRYLSKKFCLSDCDKREKADFAECVRQLSQMTWLEIGQHDRHGWGYEIIDQGSIRAGMPAHITPDVKLLAFRFSELKPMVGYKDGEIFYVLWFDRAFKLYDHG